MYGFRITTAATLALALVLFLLLLASQGRRAMTDLVSGACVFGVLLGTLSGLLGAAWCYFIAREACAPGDALLGGPFGFGLGALWFMYWWWHEARPN